MKLREFKELNTVLSEEVGLFKKKNQAELTSVKSELETLKQEREREKRQMEKREREEKALLE